MYVYHCDAHMHAGTQAHALFVLSILSAQVFPRHALSGERRSGDSHRCPNSLSTTLQSQATHLSKSQKDKG